MGGYRDIVYFKHFFVDKLFMTRTNMVESRGATIKKINIEIRDKHSFVTHMVFKTPLCYHCYMILNLISYVQRGIDVRSWYPLMFVHDMFASQHYVMAICLTLSYFFTRYYILTAHNNDLMTFFQIEAIQENTLGQSQLSRIFINTKFC